MYVGNKIKYVYVQFNNNTKSCNSKSCLKVKRSSARRNQPLIEKSLNMIKNNLPEIL